jgi:hypothetical protein
MLLGLCIFIYWSVGVVVCIYEWTEESDLKKDMLLAIVCFFWVLLPIFAIKNLGAYIFKSFSNEVIFKKRGE